VAVGSEVDVHITDEKMYPTPSTNDSSVLEATAVADGGSTESFRAVGTGTAVLTTKGMCILSDASPNAVAPCPVLEVGVL